MQGRDSVLVELVKHMEGVGLLDAYVVSVDCRQALIQSSNYCLGSTGYWETAINHWMRWMAATLVLLPLRTQTYMNM